MSNEASAVGARRSVVTGAALVVAAGLIAGGCSSASSSSTSTLACPSKSGTAVTGNAAAGTGEPAAGWAQPGADLASTRYVASAITSTDVSTLGVAWTVPLTISTTHTDGAYATTPVIVNGVVYVQDLESNVYAISLAAGKVLWRHDYNSPNGGPDGVNVAGGVVYAATAKAAVALDAATGVQLWSRTLIGNDHEGIAMAPGYNHGTVYVSTVPANVTIQYGPGGEGILWALNAKTGAPEWSWNQVQNLWGNPGVNSGGGLWYTPSFDAQGNIYMGIANPAPIFGTESYPLGSSRPGPDLYTDSVVKLSPAGKLLWYYQLTPHDLYDWDLQNPPVLTTANGRQVVIDGGKAGIINELDAQTGKLLWQDGTARAPRTRQLPHRAHPRPARPVLRTPPGAPCWRPPPPLAGGHRTAGRARPRAHAGHQGVSGPAAAGRERRRAPAPGPAAPPAARRPPPAWNCQTEPRPAPQTRCGWGPPKLAVPAGPGRPPHLALAVAGLPQAWPRRPSPRRCRRNARSAGSRYRPAARRRPGSPTATLPQAFRPRPRPVRRVASRIRSVRAPARRSEPAAGWAGPRHHWKSVTVPERCPHRVGTFRKGRAPAELFRFRYGK